MMSVYHYHPVLKSGLIALCVCVCVCPTGVMQRRGEVGRVAVGPVGPV